MVLIFVEAWLGHISQIRFPVRRLPTCLHVFVCASEYRCSCHLPKFCTWFFVILSRELHSTCWFLEHLCHHLHFPLHSGHFQLAVVWSAIMVNSTQSFQSTVAPVFAKIFISVGFAKFSDGLFSHGRLSFRNSPPDFAMLRILIAAMHTLNALFFLSLLIGQCC